MPEEVEDRSGDEQCIIAASNELGWKFTPGVVSVPGDIDPATLFGRVGLGTERGALVAEEIEFVDFVAEFSVVAV